MHANIWLMQSVTMNFGERESKYCTILFEFHSPTHGVNFSSDNEILAGDY
jgi:hypothetical protein